MGADLTAIMAIIGLLFMSYLYFFIKGTNRRIKKKRVLESFETPGGVEVEIIERGRGEGAKFGQTVFLHYVGKLPSGKIFDSSYKRGKAFHFNLGGGKVIRGWEEGIVGMKIGEERRLKIPSDMAYGDQGAGEKIPPNTSLVFEVHLMNVTS